jgi:hypothetical protein
MGTSGIASFARHYRESHQRAIALVEDLPDEDVAWRPAPHARSIGWNLWYMARRADQLQADLSALAAEQGLRPAPGRLIWEADGLARRWGLDADGPDGAWPAMLPDGAVVPALPGRGALVDYARRAFAAAEEALEMFAAGISPSPGGGGLGGGDAEMGFTLAESLMLANRRLGEIESLRGLQRLL